MSESLLRRSRSIGWVPLLVLTIAAFSACSDDDDDNNTQCPAGQVFSQTEMRCVDAAPADNDNDGVAVGDDCNDDDASLGAISADADCDGVLTADDCNDMDAMAGARSADADCDGVLTADDCNDMDNMSTTRATDADCDTVLTADDCNDMDNMSTTRATDADCDTVLTADDCDDEDESVGAVTLDRDCDGAVNDQDECPDDVNFTVSPAPAVASTFPTALSATNGSTTSVAGTVTLFCGHTLDQLTMAINDTPVTPQTQMISADSIGWRLSTNLSPNLTSTVTIQATDSFGNTGTATVSIVQYMPPAPPQQVLLVLLKVSRGILRPTPRTYPTKPSRA